MPDPTKQTISASQSSALFNRSPWMSRWMLFQHFKNGMPLDPPETARMRSGKLLQHYILARTAEDHRLEIVPNLADEYERRGRLGATIDGHMIAPDVGEIVVESKNIDGLQFKYHWTESAAPIHYEIQLQQQLFVRGQAHGLLAVHVGGNEMKYYRRERNETVIAQLVEEADAFFRSLDENRPPDLLGSELELPGLLHLYPETTKGEVLEVSDEEFGELLRQYAWATEQETFFKRIRKQLRPKILGVSGTAERVIAPGAEAKIEKTEIAALRQACPPGLGLALSALVELEPRRDLQPVFRELLSWGRDPARWPLLREAFIQTRIKVRKTEEPASTTPDVSFAA